MLKVQKQLKPLLNMGHLLLKKKVPQHSCKIEMHTLLMLQYKTGTAVIWKQFQAVDQ